MPSFDTHDPIRLDLGGVTFVDKNAKVLLSEMVANGVHIQADGPMMASVAERIISDIAAIYSSPRRTPIAPDDASADCRSQPA